MEEWDTDVFWTIRPCLDSDVLTCIVHIVAVRPASQEIPSEVEVDTVDICIVCDLVSISTDDENSHD